MSSAIAAACASAEGQVSRRNGMAASNAATALHAGSARRAAAGPLCLTMPSSDSQVRFKPSKLG